MHSMAAQPHQLARQRETSGSQTRDMYRDPDTSRTHEKESMRHTQGSTRPALPGRVQEETEDVAPLTSPPESLPPPPPQQEESVFKNVNDNVCARKVHSFIGDLVAGRRADTAQKGKEGAEGEGEPASSASTAAPRIHRNHRRKDDRVDESSRERHYPLISDNLDKCIESELPTKRHAKPKVHAQSGDYKKTRRGNRGGRQEQEKRHARRQGEK